MSKLNVSLADSKYDVNITSNNDGTKTYEISTKTYVKGFGEADLLIKMTQDSYGDFVNASASGTVTKDLFVTELSLSVQGEAIVNTNNLILNLETKADLSVGDADTFADTSTIEVTSLKFQAQIPIEDAQNGNFSNIEVASSASVFGISTTGPEVWAQDSTWNDWQNMTSEQQAQAINGGYGPFTTSWSDSVSYKIEQYKNYMENVIGDNLEDGNLEYFDGNSAVINKDDGSKIVFHKTNDNTEEKYTLDKDGNLKSYEIKNESGQYQKFKDTSLSEVNQEEVQSLSNTLNNPTLDKTSLENSINNIDKSNLTEPIEVGVASLKDGQTISHIAANTPYNSIELLDYNNLTLEQAKNLPVGYEVQIPKDITVIDGEYGTIKIYEGYDETGVILTPNEKITYDENSDLLIHGDNDKITFTDKETGNYQEWTKDTNGSLYQSLESNNDLSISYEMIDGQQVTNNIEIHSDNVSLDEIASYTSYTKEDLQAFNFLDKQRKVA